MDNRIQFVRKAP